MFDRFLVLARPAAGAALAITLGMQFASAAPAQAHDFPNDLIARNASARKIGSSGGQCKVFAQDVVNDVLRARHIRPRIGGYGSPGGAYYGTYKRAGGVRVNPRDGEPGDLIQVIAPRFKTSDSPPRRDSKGRSRLHTAIIVDRLGPGYYRVRDSNWHGDETVQQHKWRPLTWRKHGTRIFVWRFGAVRETASASATMPSKAPAIVARVLTDPAFVAIWPLGLLRADSEPARR